MAAKGNEIKLEVHVKYSADISYAQTAAWDKLWDLLLKPPPRETGKTPSSLDNTGSHSYEQLY
jgi:hypothetical protein